MLKTIPTHQVKLGMHIHALTGAWVDHPFWKNNFTLQNPADLKKLQESSVKEIIIDTVKGLTLDASSIPAQTYNERELIEDVKALEPIKTTTKRVSASEERKQASRTINASKKAVALMFKDVRMGKVINTEELGSLVNDIASSVSRNESALISLARLKTKDDYTYMHSVAVCGLMIALSRQLNLSEAETKQAGLAGLLHDVGKAAIPLEMLNKPGALTDKEFDLVKSHPVLGHQLLLDAKVADTVALDVCLHHHEKIDGSGYPEKLKEAQISLFARMGAVCDVYDAVTSNRPYKEGWDPAVSLQRMAQWKGHFDEVIFKAFVKSLGIYPIGSTVKLRSGKLAIVIDQSPKSLLTPIVKVFFSTKSKSRIPMITIDLSKNNARDEVEGYEDPMLWGIENVDEIWSKFEVWD